MKKLLLLSLSIFFASHAQSQTVTSQASQLKAWKPTGVVMPFRFEDEGVATPIEWGLDLAWLDENNIRRGVAYAGKEVIDIVRACYRTTDPVDGGALSNSQIRYITTRANIIKRHLKSNVQVNINHDHTDNEANVNPWYNEGTIDRTARGQRWSKVIDLSIKKYKELGVTNFVSISPYNEPDFGWWQGYVDKSWSSSKQETSRMEDFLATAKSLKEDYNGAYDNVRICGGNTLNDDRAYDWWNFLKDYLDEGNTHQLAGSFNNYANFFQKVREYGHHTTADELHNTMEAMVGVEYGMQTGIWWYTCEHARSQFMKATYQGNPGKRLAYAEHRNNWTSAAIYRLPDGRVQLFGGTSERQAVSTTYDAICLDRNVWYNGARGRQYTLNLPGGTGYQIGQVNAETVVDIEAGDDIMPVINGTYKLMNARTGMLMGFSTAPSTSGWTSVKQYANKDVPSMQWVVNPMPIRTGEDFSYYFITLNTGANMRLDLHNGDLANGGDIGVYKNDDTPSKYQRWFLEYAGNGAFYVRNEHSPLYLTVVNGSTTSGANVQLNTYTGGLEQQWRFVPATVTTPRRLNIAAPTGLTAVGQGSSIVLEWNPSTSANITSYTLIRSKDGEHYETIAKDLTETSFTDCEALDGVTYYYQVYAIDQSLNYSKRSEAVTASVTGAHDQVVYLPFDYTLNDTTLNGNHCSVYGNTFYQASGKLSNSLRLSGTNNFVQLPYTVASHDALTVACWLYWRGGDAWQRLWDFGNGTSQYMFFTPKSDSGMRFSIKNGGDEQQVRSSRNMPLNKWTHVALTIDNKGAKLYINGELEAENTEIDILPSDFHPSLNYIGHSQFAADPDLKAYVDDFRIFNYALTPSEINELVAYDDGVEEIKRDGASEGMGKAVYDLSGRRTDNRSSRIFIKNGKKYTK